MGKNHRFLFVPGAGIGIPTIQNGESTHAKPQLEDQKWGHAKGCTFLSPLTQIRKYLS